MDHQLENLGPERFQQLVQALLVSQHPNVMCFPISQPDGGRDALRFIEDADELSKFIVYQVKFSRDPSSIENVSKWMLETADGEIDKVRRLADRGASTYVLITNVSGTAHLDVGSMDKVLRQLTQ